MILAVGTRFAGVEALEEQKVVQIDIDEQEIGRNHTDTVGVAGDAKLALQKNSGGVSGGGATRGVAQGGMRDASGPSVMTRRTRSSPWVGLCGRSGSASRRTGSWCRT